MKKYIVKLYDESLGFLAVVNPRLIGNKISFPSFINGGQGALSLDLIANSADRIVRGFADYEEGTFIDVGHFIKVFEISENDPEGRQIYFGVIEDYRPFVDERKEGVRLVCNGIYSMLGRFFYRDSDTDYEVSIDDDPRDVIIDIIDNFSGDYPGLISAGAEMDSFATDANLSFSEKTWLAAVEEAFSKTDESWYWFIDSSGVFILKQKPATATHLFTIKKDMVSVNVNNAGKGIRNFLRLTHGAGTKNYSDAASITAYGLRGEIKTNTSAVDEATADLEGNKFIEENKNPKQSILVELNNSFDFGKIRPGHTCTLLFGQGASSLLPENMLIVKTTYQEDGMIVELEEETRDFNLELKKIVS